MNHRIPSPANAGQNWKLLLAYDGTAYHGWQVQPGRLTVQGELVGAIERITGERILPQGSGRTDAGVHALGQVASFHLRAPLPAANLQRALNRALPAAIRVLEVAPVPTGFHARHDAIAKTYEYRVYRGELCPPFLARYVYALNWPLDEGAIFAAAPAILGEHDFTSFAATDPDLARRRHPAPENGDAPGPGRTNPDDQSTAGPPPGNIRTVLASEWSRNDAETLIYRITGTGFLHHMVRNLVGTFLEIGRGQISPDALPQILAARDRSRAGATAPARGLFLVSVQYPGHP